MVAVVTASAVSEPIKVQGVTALAVKVVAEIVAVIRVALKW